MVHDIRNGVKITYMNKYTRKNLHDIYLIHVHDMVQGNLCTRYEM